MKYTTPTLETERLILKKGNLDDYEKVYEYNFLKLRDIGGEFEFEKQNLDDIKDFPTYADLNEDVLDWILYLKDGTPIGNVTADRVIKEINSIELACNLHPNFWGKGYMKEAFIEIMDYLYNLGFDNIMCGYSEGNIKSKKFNEKFGFVFYSKDENAWIKNGIPITDYHLIMNKSDYYSKYKNIEKNR